MKTTTRTFASPIEILADIETAGRTSWTAAEVRTIVAQECFPDYIRMALLHYAMSLELLAV